jgi:hypothetical protein
MPVANCGCVYHAEQGIPCKHDVEIAMFRADVDTFFDAAFQKMEAGGISLDQVGELFPTEVKVRNSATT